MPLEIRPAAMPEMDEYRRVALSSLVLAPQNVSPDAILAVHPEMTLCAFADGQLATAYAAWPLKMRINGGVIPTAGVTYVGTLPHFRGRGYLRRITTRHFELMHARGEQPLAALLASQAAIYQRYGYAVVSTRNAYRFEPRFIGFVPAVAQPSRSVRLRELGENEPDTLERLYRTFTQARTGYLHRGRSTWKSGVLRKAPQNSVLFKIICEEDGLPSGYLVYTVEPTKVPDGHPWQRVFVRDLIWLSHRAYTALWDHLATFALAAEIVWMRVPPDDPLPHLLLEPRRLNLHSADGVLARIADVECALPLRGYAGEGVLTFEVIDALCPWNAGRWRLETMSGGTQIRRTDLPAQIRLPVDTLAMLWFGQISASAAFHMGRLDVLEPNALATWDRLLGTAHKPFCPDFF